MQQIEDYDFQNVAKLTWNDPFVLLSLLPPETQRGWQFKIINIKAIFNYFCTFHDSYSLFGKVAANIIARLTHFLKNYNFITEKFATFYVIKV